MSAPLVGSLFAGIGGFELGFERAGFRTAWQAEIDPAAQGVLRRHFPGVNLYGDVRELSGLELAPVDVVTFGSPCQDFSAAGKRAGLAGDRSGLFHEAVRLIRELRGLYGRPEFVVWENVLGALSSNGGDDFAAILQAMVDCGATDVAWRVLDSRGFGVPQRRRRLFIVADFGDGRRSGEVLLDAAGRGGTPPARRGKDAGAFARSDETESGVLCLEHGDDWDACGCYCIDDAFCPWCQEWTSGLHYTLEVDGLTCCGAWFRRLCGTLSDGAHRGGGLNGQDVLTGRVVVDHKGRPRRLTPTECERLQGFPDGWTREVAVDRWQEVVFAADCNEDGDCPACGDDFGECACVGPTEEGVVYDDRGGVLRGARSSDRAMKPQADGPRYKQLGNAVSVPVAEWIAGRIAAVAGWPITKEADR